MKLTRRQFLKAAAAGVITTGAFGGGSFVYATQIEPTWVEIERVGLRLPRLESAFDGYRILQISDLHVDGHLTDRERFLAMVELVNAQEYDALVITGDFVTDHVSSGIYQVLLDGLGSLRARDGKFAVLGNHDHWTNALMVRRALEESQFTELANSVFTLRRGESQLHICGVDDIWENHHRLERVLDQLPDQGAAILLAHEPDFADISAAANRFDLQLSGHSHGGQVRLPIVGAPMLPYLGRKYYSGLYQVGSMLQYTNRGVGAVQPFYWCPPVRLNCRPEITIFTLYSS